MGLKLDKVIRINNSAVILESNSENLNQLIESPALVKAKLTASKPGGL